MALDPRTIARRQRDREASQRAALHSNAPVYARPDNSALAGVVSPDTTTRSQRPRANTNANARWGGRRISYFDPAEHAVETITNRVAVREEHGIALTTQHMRAVRKRERDQKDATVRELSDGEPYRTAWQACRNASQATGEICQHHNGEHCLACTEYHCSPLCNAR